MERLGNDVIALLSRALHYMWNFSISEITRLLNHSWAVYSLEKSLIIILIVALVVGLLWHFGSILIMVFREVMMIVVYGVTLIFLLGATAGLINWLLRTVPSNLIAKS